MPSPHLPEDKRHQALARFSLLRPFLEEGMPLARLAQEHDLPVRTARRWVQQYRREGLAGLARKTRADRGAPRRLTTEMRVLIEGFVLQTPRPTVAFVHRQIVAIARTQGRPIPSYDCVYDIVRQLDGLGDARHMKHRKSSDR